MFGKRIVALQKNSADVKMFGSKDGHTSVLIWIDLPGDGWDEVLNILNDKFNLNISAEKRTDEEQ